MSRSTRRPPGARSGRRGSGGPDRQFGAPALGESERGTPQRRQNRAAPAGSNPQLRHGPVNPSSNPTMASAGVITRRAPIGRAMAAAGRAIDIRLVVRPARHALPNSSSFGGDGGALAGGGGGTA